MYRRYCLPWDLLPLAMLRRQGNIDTSIIRQKRTTLHRIRYIVWARAGTAKASWAGIASRAPLCFLRGPGGRPRALSAVSLMIMDVPTWSTAKEASCFFTGQTNKSPDTVTLCFSKMSLTHSSPLEVVGEDDESLGRRPENGLEYACARMKQIPSIPPTRITIYERSTGTSRPTKPRTRRLYMTQSANRSRGAEANKQLGPSTTA